MKLLVVLDASGKATKMAQICSDCDPEVNQPKRSKREDSPKCEMRCSEHCGNTVREVQ